MLTAITVCVGFDDLLAITLPLNQLRGIDNYWIVTSPDDLKTQELAQSHGCHLHITDAFYRQGCVFNKGLALEEAFDAAGREGWFVLLDADIILPDTASWPTNNEQNLYGATRHIVANVRQWLPTMIWKKARPDRYTRPFGYLQLFHSSARGLQTQPWYPCDWRHAGGSDSWFLHKWPATHRVKLPWPVVHLGVPGKDWCGRASDRCDGLAVADQSTHRHNMRQLGKHVFASKNPLDKIL